MKVDISFKYTHYRKQAKVLIFCFSVQVKDGKESQAAMLIIHRYTFSRLTHGRLKKQQKAAELEGRERESTLNFHAAFLSR